MIANAKKSYTAPALEKGLDILELLATEPEGLTLSDIASRLSRSVSEIFRMLAVLEQREYIFSPQRSDNYHLTLKLFEISHQLTPLKQLTSAALPVLKSVTREVEQSCHVAVYYQGKVMIVAQEDSPADKGFSVRLGAEVDLFDSCSGRVLLAFASAEQRQTMLDEKKRYRGAKSTPRKLNKQLQDIRDKGYDSLASSHVNGVTDIGYPIFSYTGEIMAALTMPFLEHIDGSHSVNFKQTSTILGEAAFSISRAMGYSGT
jgi:DNA-binding IclR family transcriptional regulator